ncbi:hypothetical protein VTO58DRAFT_107758 [Aureobasidium pullulans]
MDTELVIGTIQSILSFLSVGIATVQLARQWHMARIQQYSSYILVPVYSIRVRDVVVKWLGLCIMSYGYVKTWEHLELGCMFFIP